MTKMIAGIHHVTAIASDPQQNLDFYAGMLGLRLVKITINFDDPGSYHFYYGDALGYPGSVLTFFPWPGARRGRIGTDQVSVTSFSVPQSSFPYWQNHLKEHGVQTDSSTRFEEPVLSFTDGDGLWLELIGSAMLDERPAWSGGPVPQEHAIRGFHSATLSEEGYERTAQLLTETMGFRLLQEEGNRFRYAAGDGGPGATVDVVCQPGAPRGSMGAGTVHHIAWRAKDDAEQLAWRAELVRQGLNVSPVMDRQYFHSIYYREPGGILFEIATDPPGFTWDESPETLGTHLKLPPWLESYRSRIEGALPPLRLPHTSSPSSGA